MYIRVQVTKHEFIPCSGILQIPIPIYPEVKHRREPRLGIRPNAEIKIKAIKNRGKNPSESSVFSGYFSSEKGPEFLLFVLILVSSSMLSRKSSV